MMFKAVARPNFLTSVRRMASGAAAHEGGMDLWRKMSFFVAFPAVAVMSVNIFLHLKQEHDCPHPRKEFIPYEHLRIRNKRFPWGDGQKSFFHNSHANALPDGYEDH